MIRLIFSFLICVFILIPFQGCQVGGSKAFVQGTSPEENNATYEGDPVTGDWIVLNLLDEPENLNPFISTSASATMIYNGYIYESFLRTKREPPWDDEPLLVENLPESSDDHLIYKWKLREDIKWHDGKPLTMNDAEFTLKAIMDPYVDDLPTKPYYKELDSVQVHDDFRMTMFCSKPYFLHSEFLGSFSVIPKHIFDSKGLLDDISYFQVLYGTGYEVIASFLEDEQPESKDDVVPGAILYQLRKRFKNITDEEYKFKEVTTEINGWDEFSAGEKVRNLKDYFEGKENSENIISSIEDYSRSITKMFDAIPFIGEISSSLSDDEKNRIQKYCEETHEKIKVFGEEFNLHPYNREPTVGSGPYIFDHWDTGQEIVVRRNEDYWRGDGHAYLDKIVYRVLTDQTASLVALKNGEIDFMESLKTIQYLTMTNRDKFLNNFIKSTYLIPSYSYLGWRNEHPIFKDRKVRLAMTHMVRRKELAEKLLFGFARIVTGPFYRYGPDYDSTITPWVYDPERAIELLTEAGWEDTDQDGILEKDDMEFKFELLVPSGSAFASQLASILREDLYMIGIEMNIRRLEWSVFINNYIRNHNFDACYLGWVFGLRGDPKQVWHSESATGRGSNHVEFKNERVDSLIDAARVEFDQDKRVAMYHEFQQILHYEQPYTFLFSSMVKPAYDKRFKGVKWYPFRPGFQLDEWFVPKEEQKY